MFLTLSWTLYSPMAQATPDRRSTQKVKLLKGVKAPFEGFLLSYQAMSKIVADYEARIKILQIKLDSSEKSCKTKLKHKDVTCKVKLASKEAEMSIERSLNAKTLKLYESYAKPKWFSSPYFSGTLGVILGAGV